MTTKMLGTACTALLVIALVLTMVASNAHAQGTEFRQIHAPQGSEFGRIFGALNTYGASGGSEAYLTTPDPLVFPGSWSIALTATGSYPGYPCIEAGSIKNCGVGVCLYNPYYSYYANDGTYDFHEFTQYNLIPGGWYQYKNYYIGNNQWEAQYCPGTGCIVLADIYLGIAGGMPYEASGGESTNTLTSIGTATSYNRWWHIYNGVWSNYCWNTEQKNVPGTLTACGSNYDWSVYWLAAGRVLIPLVQK